MRYGNKWPQYARDWDRMTIKPNRQKEFTIAAETIFAHKDIYKDIELFTTVPWYLIAILHLRESDMDFKTYLGNGDPLSRQTVNVPAGRGPFTGEHAFRDGAIDALKVDGLSSVKDWRLEKILYYCEIYNGAGYDMRGLPSPYVWGGTNIQKAGKYVSDGRFSSSAWDGQPGCAAILKTLMAVDPSIVLKRED